MRYETFISRARKHAASSDAAQVQLMHLLLEVEALPGIWREHHGRWSDLLRVERLCTPKRFRDFKKGVALRLNVGALGVDATCLLASYRKDLREQVLPKVLQWVREHKIAPTYQLVAEYTKLSSSSHRAPKRPQLKKKLLLAYIKTLQGLCRQHGISYPPLPKVTPT